MTSTTMGEPSRALKALTLKLLTSQEMWVGLITEFPGKNVSLEFLETLELSDLGYSRQRVPGWELAEEQARATVAFHNGTNAFWRRIAAMFIATSSGANGVVVEVLPMRFGTHDLPPGGSIEIPITLDL